MELKKEKKAGKGNKGNTKNKRIDGRLKSNEGKERRKWGVMYGTEEGKESRERKERKSKK